MPDFSFPDRPCTLPRPGCCRAGASAAHPSALLSFTTTDPTDPNFHRTDRNRGTDGYLGRDRSDSLRMVSGPDRLLALAAAAIPLPPGLTGNSRCTQEIGKSLVLGRLEGRVEGRGRRGKAPQAA